MAADSWSRKLGEHIFNCKQTKELKLEVGEDHKLSKFTSSEVHLLRWPKVPPTRDHGCKDVSLWGGHFSFRASHMPANRIICNSVIRLEKSES